VFTKAFQFAFLGLLGGIAAFALSRPFLAEVPLHNVNPHYTLGSFFGWFSHALLGGFVGAILSAAIAYGRNGARGMLLGVVLGLTLGAIGAAAIDALYDLILIKISGSAGVEETGLGGLAWIFLVSAGISLAVFVAIGSEASQWKRCFITAVAATVAAGVLDRFASWFVFMDMIGSASVKSAQALSTYGPAFWESKSPVFLVRFCEIGLSLGFAFGLIEATIRPPRLRLLRGDNAWKDWSLSGQTYAIGTSDQAQIRVLGFQDVKPIHARVAKQGDRYAIQAVEGPLLVNNLPTTNHLLLEGDILILGDATLLYGSSSDHPGVQPHRMVMAPVLPAQPRLQDDLGNLYPLVQIQNVIGRDQAANVPIPWDAQASKRHAMIELGPDGPFISDLGSRNGTSVSGQKIAGSHALRDGEVIEVGTTRFTFRV